MLRRLKISDKIEFISEFLPGDDVFYISSDSLGRVRVREAKLKSVIIHAGECIFVSTTLLRLTHSQLFLTMENAKFYVDWLREIKDKK